MSESVWRICSRSVASSQSTWTCNRLRKYSFKSHFTLKYCISVNPKATRESRATINDNSRGPFIDLNHSWHLIYHLSDRPIQLRDFKAVKVFWKDIKPEDPHFAICLGLSVTSSLRSNYTPSNLFWKAYRNMKVSKLILKGVTPSRRHEQLTNRR